MLSQHHLTFTQQQTIKHIMLFLSSGHQACPVPDDRPVSRGPGTRDLQPHREGHYHILIFTFNITIDYFLF